MNNATKTSALPANLATTDIERYSREELQTYIAEAIIGQDLPGKAVKATRAARAMMRLAAAAEIEAGYGEAEFMAYCRDAFRKVAAQKAAAKKTLGQAPTGKAALGMAKPSALAGYGASQTVKVLGKLSGGRGGRKSPLSAPSETFFESLAF